jgi:YD repeat-containing protein
MLLLRRLLLVVFVVCGVAVASAQSTVQYLYDDGGRLIGVIDGNGEAAKYTYDLVGNLLSIDRYSSTITSVLTFSPATGPAGTTVTVHGTGFSTTANQNAVTFNGTPSTVSAATTTQLTVTVPSGATTGYIAVTAPNGSASSTVVFIVGSASAGPSITSFAPTLTIPGTAFTVTGTNFETIPTSNVLRVNTAPGQIGSATATSIGATVPPNVATGRVSVATPKGTATSSSYLWVAPPPYAVSDISSTTALPFSTPTSVSVPAANTVGLMAFDNVEGHRASVSINGVSGGFATVYLYDPLGKLLRTVSGILVDAFLDTISLRSSGTYSLVFDPTFANPAGATLTLYDVPADVTGPITAGGTSATVTTTVPGQNGRLTFTASANQRVSLYQSGFNCFSSTTTIVAPDGTSAASSCGGTFIDVTTLSAAGTYTLLIDPKDAATGSTTETLYNVPADAVATIIPGGSAVTLTTTTPGQNGSLTFTGTAGQRVFLQGTNGMTGWVFGCDVFVKILKPDGSVLASDVCMEGSGFIDVTTLPTTGTYTVVMNPLDVATGSLTLTLYAVPTDTSGTITAGGSAVTVTTTVPGQNGSLTFSGTAGDRISLGGTNGMTGQVGFACDVNVSILNPNGSVLAAGTCMEGSGFIDVTTLGSTGTFTIKIDPAETAVGSVTLTLYSVPADASASVTVGGSAATLTTTTPGQNARATFAGTASQPVTVHLTGSGMGWVTVTLLKPDGTVLTSASAFWSDFDLSTQTLPTSGTYTIVIDPWVANIGSITVNVTNP